MKTQIRSSNGRWKKTGGWIGRIFIALIIAISISPFLPKRALEVNNIPMVPNVASAETITPEIVEKMKKDVVERLQASESKGHEIKDGEMFITLDPNSKMKDACLRIGGKSPVDCYSFGVFQIKISTAQRWYKMLYQKDITEMEAMNIVLDKQKAESLAIDAIVGIEGAIYEWSGALKDREFYDYIIPLIREYSK